jgi:hypothetical protein
MSQNDDEKGSKRYNNPSLGTNNPQRRLLEHPSSLLAHENGFDSKKFVQLAVAGKKAGTAKA